MSPIYPAFAADGLVTLMGTGNGHFAAPVERYVFRE